MSAWLECQTCLNIFPGQALVLSIDGVDSPESDTGLPEQLCPRCGCKDQTTWCLPDALDDWLLTVEQTVTSHETDQDRVGAVFVAAACESMLRDIIGFALARQRIPAGLTSFVLANARGAKQLSDLYAALANTSVKDVLTHARLAAWHAAWNRLTRIRNQYAHGSHATSLATDDIRQVISGLNKAFVSLRNAVTCHAPATRCSEP